MRKKTIKGEMDFSEVKDKALRLLTFRSHSEYELVQKLKRAGAQDADIEAVLEFLRTYKFLDDEAYAIRTARDLKHLKKYGKHRIVAELRNRGLSSSHIDAAISELSDDEEDVLLPLVERKLAGNFEQKNIDKCIRYFVYRGYEFGDIKRCIGLLKEE